MSLNQHDELLLKDLKLQPVWLMILYVILGLVFFTVGMSIDDHLSKWLCGGGGFLVALGSEKLVSRRIRYAAMKLLEK